MAIPPPSGNRGHSTRTESARKRYSFAPTPSGGAAGLERAEAAAMDREKARRVAVVAVHGVGHHEPREAARAAADLPAGSSPTSYSPFVESPLRIPVSKLEVGAAPQRPKGLMHAFDERASFLREAHESHAPAPAPELQYMREQLSGYEPTGSDHIYDTIVVSATRTDPQGGPP